MAHACNHVRSGDDWTSRGLQAALAAAGAMVVTSAEVAECGAADSGDFAIMADMVMFKAAIPEMAAFEDEDMMEGSVLNDAEAPGGALTEVSRVGAWAMKQGEDTL